MDDLKKKEQLLSAIKLQEAENLRLEQARHDETLLDANSANADAANKAYAAGVERMQALMQESRKRGYS